MKTTLFFLFSALLVAGCNNSTNSDKAIDDHSSHSSENAAASIELNNGEKWSVNEEMKPFIQESETILAEYVENDFTDYQNLASQLKEKNSALISSCTMQGKSHDELHKWLHPHMKLIDNLANAQSAEDAERIVAELEVSFETYNQYFR